MRAHCPPSIACCLTIALSLGACFGSLDSGPRGPLGSGGDGHGTPPDADAQPGVDTAVFGLCQGGEELPGPRLLRLLTRRELQNTLRDLLHIPVPDTSRVPIEARVRSFDNNAAAQAVTSRHVDEYLALAEIVSEKAVREQRAQLLHCNASSADCPANFIREFGLLL